MLNRALLSLACTAALSVVPGFAQDVQRDGAPRSPRRERVQQAEPRPANDLDALRREVAELRRRVAALEERGARPGALPQGGAHRGGGLRGRGDGALLERLRERADRNGDGQIDPRERMGARARLRWLRQRQAQGPRRGPQTGPANR